MPNTLFLHHVACHTKITSNKDNINELIAALQYLFFCSESVGFQFFLMHNACEPGWLWLLVSRVCRKPFVFPFCKMVYHRRMCSSLVQYVQPSERVFFYSANVEMP